MERTTTWTLAFAALLMTVPTVAADDASAGPDPEGEDAGPCDVFWYTLDPPGYKLNLDCLPLPEA